MYDSNIPYATKDEYLAFAGIDLMLELKSGYSDNPSKRAEIFIKNVQTWLYMHISTHYEISEWDDDTFKSALLWQIKYVLKHGEDSELDDTAYSIMHETGMINPQSEERYYRRW